MTQTSRKRISGSNANSSDRRLVGRIDLHAGRSGFSLVELMVVLGIVAILATLIFPTAQNALERSRATKCAGNLRQLGIAFTLYAQENNGYLPPVKESGALSALSWYRLVGPYLGRTTTNAFGAIGTTTDYPGYMGCPSVKPQEKEGYTYGVNYMGVPSNPKAAFGWLLNGGSQKLGNLRAGCFLAGDSHVGDLPWNYLIMNPNVAPWTTDSDGDGTRDSSPYPPNVPYGGMEPRHFHGANFVCADGSVKWLTVKQWISNDSRIWDTQ